MDDPALSGSLTRAIARELWGPGHRYGPQWEYVVYSVEDNAGGRVGSMWLWFQPEPPHELRRAIFVDDAELDHSRRHRMILNLIPETQNRTVEDIPLKLPLRLRDVAAAWGPPDAEIGSGVTYWLYYLADGDVASLWGIPHDRDPDLVTSLRVSDRDLAVVTEDRNLPTFVSLSARGSMYLHITVGENQSVRIVTNDPARRIATEVREGVLFITDMGSRMSRGPVHVAISVAQLNNISLRDTDSVEVENVRADRFHLDIVGGSGVYLSGACGGAELSIRGAADVSAKELLCRDVAVEVLGSGHADIHASGVVNVRVMGSGDVDVHGDGQIASQRILGSGDVTVRDD